jgi:hypothetical protein
MSTSKPNLTRGDSDRARANSKLLARALAQAQPRTKRQTQKRPKGSRSPSRSPNRVGDARPRNTYAEGRCPSTIGGNGDIESSAPARLFTLAKEGGPGKNDISSIQNDGARNHLQSFIAPSMSPVIPNNSQDQMHQSLMQLERQDNSQDKAPGSLYKFQLAAQEDHPLGRNSLAPFLAMEPPAPMKAARGANARHTTKPMASPPDPYQQEADFRILETEEGERPKYVNEDHGKPVPGRSSGSLGQQSQPKGKDAAADSSQPTSLKNNPGSKKARAPLRTESERFSDFLATSGPNKPGQVLDGPARKLDRHSAIL